MLHSFRSKRPVAGNYGYRRQAKGFFKTDRSFRRLLDANLDSSSKALVDTCMLNEVCIR